MSLFARLLVAVALFLDSKQTYIQAKIFLRDALEDDLNPYKKYFDFVMIFLVLSSVAILIYDVKYDIPHFLYVYDLYVVTFIFLMEYLTRMWLYNDARGIVLTEYEESKFLNREFDTKKVIMEMVAKKFEYMRTPFAIIDILAILPAYRPVRVLRVFVLFRLFKVLRYTKSMNSFLEIVSSKKFELVTLLLLIGFITFVGGAIIYIFEYEKNTNISSFFDAIYWSLVTISTVGYGDISPVTDVGRALTMILIMAGIGFISFTTSIITSAFTEKLEELKLNRVKIKINKLDNYYLVCGYGQISKIFCKKLEQRGEKFVIIDTDDARIDEANSDGYLTFKGDITDRNVIKRFKFSKMREVFVMLDDDILNTFIILSIKSYAPHSKIIAVASNDSNKMKMEIAGAYYVVIPSKVSALLAYVYVGAPVTFEVIDAILSEKRNAVLDEVEVLKDSFLENKMISEVEFDRYKLILFGVLKKGEGLHNTKEDFMVEDKKFFFNPNAFLKIEAGDAIVVLGYNISVNHFKFLVQKSAL